MIFSYRKGAVREVELAIKTDQFEGEADEAFEKRKAALEAVTKDVRLKVKNLGRRAALRLGGLLGSDLEDRYERIVREACCGAPGLTLLSPAAEPLDAGKLEGDDLVDALDAAHLLEAAAVAAVLGQQPTLEQRNFLG